MPQDPLESRLLVLIEPVVVLLVAFVGSMGLGFVAFFATAVVLEDKGVGILVEYNRKLVVSLTPADVAEPPSLDEAADIVRDVLPGADVIVLPEEEDSWTLTAWYEDELPEGSSGAISAELMHLGWEHPDSTLTVQPSLMAAMENPRRMKLYLPPLMGAQALCFIAMTMLMLRWRRPRAFAKTAGLPAVFGWGVLTAVGAFVLSTLIGLTLNALGLEIEEQAWIQALMSDGNTLLLLSPLLVLIGPISEEVFFRGYVFRRLYFGATPAWAYAVSAVLFGLIHLHWVGIPMYITIGLMFCWVHRKTGTLWAPVVAHVVYNAGVLLIPFLVSP